MKNLLFPLAVAAFFGLPVASALNADNARVTLDVSNGGDLRVESISPMTIFGGKDAKQARTDKSTTWQYVTIPLKVEAKCKGDRSPNYVDELKVHVYAVFGGEKGDEPIMLDKEITYVDIPVSGKSGGKLSEGHMNAGIFISPANASKIINSNSKVELGDKLIAVAIEASFHDSPCIAGDTEPFAVVDSKYKQKLTGAWWKKSSKNKQGAELSAISETPFAPFYAPVFPPTKPLYGSAEGSSSSSSSSASSVSDDDTASSADSSASASDATSTTTSVSTGSGKKSKKK